VDYPAYRGDDGYKQIVIGNNKDVTIVYDGSEIFGDMFKTFCELQAVLEDPIYDSDAISDLLEPLNQAVDNIQTVRTKGASLYTILEINEEQLSALQLNVENLLSATESADMEEAAVKLQSQQTAYDAALEAVSMIFEHGNLIDRLA